MLTEAKQVQLNKACWVEEAVGNGSKYGELETTYSSKGGNCLSGQQLWELEPNIIRSSIFHEKNQILREYS